MRTGSSELPYIISTLTKAWSLVECSINQAYYQQVVKVGMGLVVQSSRCRMSDARHSRHPALLTVTEETQTQLESGTLIEDCIRDDR